MDLEAVQKAYAALKKDGITKNPKKAILPIMVGGRERYIFASPRVVALVNILQQELIFPPFYTRGIPVRLPLSPFIACKDDYVFDNSLKKGLSTLKELFATARCFI